MFTRSSGFRPGNSQRENEYLIQAENLSRRYGDLAAVKGVTVEVEQREIPTSLIQWPLRASLRVACPTSTPLPSCLRSRLLFSCPRLFCAEPNTRVMKVTDRSRSLAVE
jgi:hypothetical protein